MDTSYQPGSNPNIYYLCYEDNVATGGDQDFQDVVIRVKDNQNGSYDLTISGATAGKHTLVSKPERQVLTELGTGFYQNLTASVGVADEETSTSGQAAPTANMYEPDTMPSSSAAILSSNYAMNADTKYATYRSGRVMLLDYFRYIFHYTDDWTAPSLDPNRDGTPNFARHRGRINVLLVDGSVQFMDPAELDPISPQAYAQYWAP